MGLLHASIENGDRIHVRYDAGSGNIVTYDSYLADALSPSEFLITVPLSGTVPVLFEDGTEFLLYFRHGKTFLNCRARIAGRSVDGNVHLYRMSLSTSFSRGQMRSYYRVPITIDVHVRQADSGDTVDSGEECITRDLSGGGLCFVSKRPYEKGSGIVCLFSGPDGNLPSGSPYPCEVIRCEESVNSSGRFAVSAKFSNMDEKEWERIVKFVFGVEREMAKKR